MRSFCLLLFFCSTFVLKGQNCNNVVVELDSSKLLCSYQLDTITITNIQGLTSPYKINIQSGFSSVNYIIQPSDLPFDIVSLEPFSDIKIKVSDTNNVCSKTFNLGYLFSDIVLNSCGQYVDLSDAVNSTCSAISNISFVPSSGYFDIGSHIITATVTDTLNNTYQTIFNVDVYDNVPPIIICPNFSITEYASPTSCSATINIPVATAYDDCGGAYAWGGGYSATFVGAATHTKTVTYYAEDASGNISSKACTYSITIIDNVAPIIQCPASTIRKGNDPGKCGADVTIPIASATDNCGVANITGGGYSNYYEVGTHSESVTYTATDIYGNSSTIECNITIIVEDREAPKIECPGDTILYSDQDKCGKDVNIPKATATDNCDEEVEVTSDFNGSVFVEVDKPIIVTYTATDLAGNTASCYMTITVLDTVKPKIIVCPDDIEVNNDPGECKAKVYWNVEAEDNCPGVKIICNYPPGHTFLVNTPTLVICHAIDAHNNISDKDCRFLVTVKDKEGPSIECPDDIEVDNDPGKCGAYVTLPMASATDNCDKKNPDVSSDKQEKYYEVGTHTETITYTSTDKNGNSSTKVCTITITVKDTESPILRRKDGNPSNEITVGNKPGECNKVVEIPEMEVVDNCGPFTGYSIINNGPTLPLNVGEHKYKVTASNDFNPYLFISYEFNITVEDREAPTIEDECPMDIEVFNDDGECGATVTFPLLTATDNCDKNPNVIAYSESEYYPIGVNTATVTYTATDASGNSSSKDCIITIIVNEDYNTTPTSFSYQDDEEITINTDEQAIDCKGKLTEDYFPTYNGCDKRGYDIISSIPVGSMVEDGDPVTFTAMIDGEEIAEVSVTIRVEDATIPEAKAKDISETIMYDESFELTEDMIEDGSSDNCTEFENLVKQLSQTTFTCEHAGNNIITYEVTDEAGNTGSTSFNVHITLDYADEEPDPENPCSILPITLKSFTISCKDNHKVLNWTTLSELNNDYFIVEKSDDAINWGAIGKVKGAGNSNIELNYSFIDENSYSNCYYRLRQVDYDGRYEIHPIGYAECIENSPNLIIAYPNPAQNKVTLEIHSVSNHNKAELNIISTDGIMILRKEIDIVKGKNLYELDVTNLISGIYYISLDTYLLNLFSPKSISILK